MSPTEITANPPAILTQQAPTAYNNSKRPSIRAGLPKEGRTQVNGAVRVTSPLTPWTEDSVDSMQQKRKSSLKGTNRQIKAAKSSLKDSKRKDNKKESGRNGFRKNLSGEDVERKNTSNFQHHTDIHEYMREYREMRRQATAGHRYCSCHGAYGPEEIDKAYDSLGLPKLMHRARIMAATRRTNLPTVDQNEGSRESPEEEASDSETQSVVSQDEESGLSSPVAREKRNNLNLAPLRKQVRLPDMNNYPVQTVAGLGVEELARLATASRENRLAKEATDALTPRLRYSSPGRRMLCTPLHLQEKSLCRVIELSIPDAYHTRVDDGEKKSSDAEEKSRDLRKFSHGLGAADKGSLGLTNLSKLQKLDEAETQDDALTIAIGTSRSCQSSVLSNAISSLSETPSSSTLNRCQTVREMLTAAVRDLHPFSKNGLPDLSDKPIAENCSNSEESENATSSPKQIVSLRTYRNLSYKPSMRKFMEELYTPASEIPITAKDNSCLIAGKPLRKLDTLPERIVQPPQHTDSRIPSRYDNKFGKSCLNSPNICATKLLKRVRQRQVAAEAYESIRRVVTLESSRQKGPKLAIFSKCHTVVKPQVSVKGVAL